MDATVEISVVVLIAASMVVFALLICLMERTNHKRHDDLRLGNAWLTAATCLMLVAAATLLSHRALPFGLGAGVIVACANLGLLFGFFAMHQGLGARPDFKLFAVISGTNIAMQWALAMNGTGALMLFASTSIVNGSVALGMALIILRLSRPYKRELRLLVSFPFFVISAGHFLRLLLFAVGAPHATLVTASALIAFTLSYAALQWCFGLNALRAVRLHASLDAERLRAQELAEARARFLAHMSHEIRTPLNSVIGLADVLQGMVKDKPAQELIGHIRHSGDLLIHILNDVLDVSKLQANAVILEQRPFEISALVHQIAGSLRPQCQAKGIDLEVEITPEADGFWQGDPHRINQILQNVAGNAVKFTENGRVRVMISGADGLHLVVEDTGIGMTDVQVAHMFDEFNQADAGITRRFGGTGLGMAIVHQLVAIMEGTIRVESALGRGTRFAIRLPLQRITDLPKPVIAAKPAQTVVFDGLTVLCADDSKGNLLVLNTMLRQLGVTPQMAEDGHAALKLAEHQSFDLYLLDISMPGFSGIEALHHLRQIEKAKGAKPAFAVAATANALQADISLYLSSGFDAHLPKPVRLDALRATLLACRDAAQNQPERVLETASGQAR